MATATLSIRYRPIRIGFLVNDGSAEDLVEAAGINTLLSGGIRNPLIPISASNKEFSDQLLNLFSVDVLFAVSHTPQIDAVIKAYPYLRDPSHYAENIFYEDWQTKRNIVGYLDSLNIIDYYWEKEFKNKPRRYRSNCTLIKWDDSDVCSNLFSLRFGYFPTSYNLKYDFQDAFLKGLRSREIGIAPGRPIDATLVKVVPPIVATATQLIGYGGTWRGNGFYVGSETDFTDLLYFWNLRASGLSLEFLPTGHIARFEDFIKAYIQQLDDVPNRTPHIEDWITIYSRGNHADIQPIATHFQGKKHFVLSSCDEVIWNGLNIKPADFYFDWQQALANVDERYSRYSVSAALPEKRFLAADRDRGDRNVDAQQLAVSIDPMGEFVYPEHTLRPPFVRALNEFYSREIGVDPWRIRAEREGIGVLISAGDDSVSLYPVAHQQLIERIFELAGFKAKMSQPGLLARQIIHSMREDDPLEACRVFKITGVRKLIRSLRADKEVKWSKAIRTIGENRFAKFKTLYIESRDTPALTPIDAFGFLLKKGVFSPKASLRHRLLRTRWAFRCSNCGLEEKIRVADFEGSWRCPYCRHQHRMPGHIATYFRGRHDADWSFRKSGLFARDNNQEGAIPVIVSLLAFARILDHHGLIYSTALNLQNSKRCEIDFCVLHYGHGHEIQLGLAECKGEGQRIDQQDIDNLKQVQDSISKLGIDCYIVFSKIADIYEPEEIELFRSLMTEGRKFVILSNKELEPYHPYWDLDEPDKLPTKHALDMMGMWRNSIFLYLDQSGPKAR